jgi:predicted TPR repeat methyltransferase
MRAGEHGSAMSSGDPRADRRFLYAEDCAAEGDHATAAELLQQCLELAPDWAPAWFALGAARELLRQEVPAIAAYRRALALDREDVLGASLALARLGAAQTPSAAAPAYVARLFDQYAPRFDAHLVDRLGYRAPNLLRQAVADVCARVNRPLHFARALDLGCGTGLAGAAFRDCVDHLEGVDLSAGMIAEARTKDIYDALYVADAADHLRASSDGALDLILAADVLVYMGDLAPLFTEIARVLAHDGVFAFTAESRDGEGYAIGPGTRYAHSYTYIEQATATAGLKIAVLNQCSTRDNKGHATAGWSGVLTR